MGRESMKNIDNTIPLQKFSIGDLVRATQDYWPYLKEGQMGVITLARCDEVCYKGGPCSLEGRPGGPEYRMEWAYVGRFDMNKMPQGIRLSSLSPVEVINESL